METNFISNGGDTDNSVSKTDTFGGEVEDREDDYVVITWTIF